jgi:hypothetical protein
MTTVPLQISPAATYAVESEVRSSLDVKVNGTGWGLFTLWLSSPLCDIKLNPTQEEEHIAVIPRSQLLQSLLLPAAVSAVELFPDSLQIKVGKMIEKRLAIKPIVQYTLREGYIVMKEPRVYPDSITLLGSRYILDTLQACYTDTVVFDDVYQQLTKPITLAKQHLQSKEKWGDEPVAVTLVPELGGEMKVYDVPVTIAQTLGASDIKVVPQRLTVTLRGSVETLTKLDLASLQALILPDEDTYSASGYIKPQINLPPEISVLSTEPRYVRVISTVRMVGQKKK